MTRTYSTCFNARRAAEKAGLTGYRLEPREGGFAIMTNERAAEPAPEQAIPDQPGAIQAALTAFLVLDDRSDAAMRVLFTQVFVAGQQAGAGRKRKRRRQGPSKREIAAGLLTRPEGTTTREILDATGWPAVSVPAIAKASGLKLRQEKIGRVARYFAT